MPYVVPGEAIALLNELAEPIPAAQRDQFLRRVRALLGDAIFSPAKVVQACAKAQAELLIAPEIEEPATKRPTRQQPPRGPWRRRA